MSAELLAIVTDSLTLVAYLPSNWVVSLRYPEQYCTTMVASQYIFLC